MQIEAPNDRRRVTRIAFQAHATLSQSDQVHSVRLMEISVKGALVKFKDPIEIDDQPAVLTIKLTKGRQIAMAVRFIHRQGQDVGFVCESLDVESAALLRRLVELNLNVPNAAEQVLEEMLAPIPAVDA